MSQGITATVAGLEEHLRCVQKGTCEITLRKKEIMAAEATLTAAIALLRSLAPQFARGTIAHTDHPLRHWDRTCPACIAEGDSVCVPREFLERVRASMVGIEIPMGRLSEFTAIASAVNNMLAAAPTVPAQEPNWWHCPHRECGENMRCNWPTLTCAAPRMEVVPICDCAASRVMHEKTCATMRHDKNSVPHGSEPQSRREGET